MCGRYTISKSIDKLKDEFEAVDEPDSFDWKPRYNAAPTHCLPVVVYREGARHLSLMRWGLIPSWAKDESIGNKLINARSETLSEKPSFKNAFIRRRCLVPADGFYEWKKEGSAKTPVWIHRVDRGLLAFAGLWENWRDPKGGNIESFTVITTEANALMRPIHDRMPVILSGRDEIAKWLAAKTTPAELQPLLKPYDDRDLELHSVSPRVNSPKYDQPDCIEPSGQLSLGI